MPPNADHTYTEIIRDALLRVLYRKQEKYWRGKLLPIVLENAQYHNRTGEVYGIHYLGQDWTTSITIAIPAERLIEVQYLPLHPDFAPKIEPELKLIVWELAQLELEEYECSRFLSGLVLFPAPIEVFAKILGKQLFQECEKELAQYVLNSPNYAWDSNAQAALTTYIAHHEYILKGMNQRLLMNMITRDQIRQ